jgi:hypothetical protein
MYAIIKSYDKDVNTFLAAIARLSIPMQQVLVFCSNPFPDFVVVSEREYVEAAAGWFAFLAHPSHESIG